MNEVEVGKLYLGVNFLDINPGGQKACEPMNLLLFQ